MGYITGYASGKYTITTFFPIPTLSNVIHVTVIDTLLNSDLLRLTGDNEIWTEDDIEIWDMVNDESISIIPPDEFRARREKDTWRTGSTRWARYMKNNIEFDAGTGAAAIGTIRVSAYWVPPRSKSLNDFVYASDTRLAEIERALMTSLFEMKTGRPELAIDATGEEKYQERLRDSSAHGVAD
jgi:hypothetical protein